MKYKNIVFDFGNVIGKFNGRDLVKHFSSCEEDQELLFTAIFSRWDDIDNGSVDYEQNIDNIAASLPRPVRICRTDTFSRVAASPDADQRYAALYR